MAYCCGHSRVILVLVLQKVLKGEVKVCNVNDRVVSEAIGILEGIGIQQETKGGADDGKRGNIREGTVRTLSKTLEQTLDYYLLP